MNDLIQSIFEDFEVDETSIPVRWQYYHGSGDPYVTWMQVDADGSISGDNDLIAYVDYYDFDIYAKKENYSAIIEGVKTLLKQNGFVYQPSLSSGDMYEQETGYYHKTLNFAIPRWEE